MKNELGFTFIETIVSMVLFSIIMLMGLSFFGYAKQMEMNSKYELFALELAQNKMENVKTLDYASIVPGSDPSVPYSGINFNTTVNVATPYAGETCKTIIVNVAWGSQNLNLRNIASPAY